VSSAFREQLGPYRQPPAPCNWFIIHSVSEMVSALRLLRRDTHRRSTGLFSLLHK